MKYYDLPKEKRWLRDGDSPDSIGGRDTDVSQIAWSLEHTIKNMFPINQVPEELTIKLKDLRGLCENCEKQIEAFISLMSDIVGK